MSSTDIAQAMTTLKDTPTTLMFHAEMVPRMADVTSDDSAPRHQQPESWLQPAGELSSYSSFLASRPPVFETCAVEEILSMAHLAPQLHLHIVHLSATECIPLLRQARRRGINITAETCFHYLGFASDDIQDGDTRHKCCPPIRSQTNQDRLWKELHDAAEGCIRTVVSDHSPCTPELKLLPPYLQTEHQGDEDAAAATTRPAMQHLDSGIDMTLPEEGEEEEEKKTKKKSENEQTGAVIPTPPPQDHGDFFAAWGGISSVGLGLPILHTTGLDRAAGGDDGGATLSITDIVRLCCQATARQVGLSHRKGGLRAGLDGDVCVFDDADAWTLRTSEMRWRNRCSPWEGRTFQGRVHETWLRGRRVFRLDGENAGFVGGAPVGEAIVERRTE